ncbi:MAG: sugar ABC transporter permease [Bifidobacteriaceae bacterium]|jgi:multiple sugar transport system permease protein|nr:sugar ABC transporter permease [Bifidobacteriaceae bacterium]
MTQVARQPEAGKVGKRAPAAKPRQRVKYNRRETLAGLAFISPWIVGFLVFTAGAMIYSLTLSFSKYNLARGTMKPIGFENYADLFDDPKIVAALSNTLIYTIMAVPLEIIVALGLAALLNQAGRGAGFFRTVFYLPKMTPSVATASMFLLLLNGNTGAINQFLGWFGIEGPQWLVDSDWIKPSIVLMTLWGVSGTMVIFLAALKNVPRELYEVAELDGAGVLRRFTHVTLPMISPAVFFNTVILSIAAFQVFDQAYLLFWRDQSGGAAGASDSSLFYAVYLFQQAFRRFNFGYASAMAWLLFCIIMVVTAVQRVVSNRLVYYEGEVK